MINISATFDTERDYKCKVYEIIQEDCEGKNTKNIGFAVVVPDKKRLFLELDESINLTKSQEIKLKNAIWEMHEIATRSGYVFALYNKGILTQI